MQKFLKPFKEPSFSLVSLLIFAVTFAAVGAYIIYDSFAEVTLPSEPQSYTNPWIGFWEPYAASDPSVLAATQNSTKVHESVIQIFMNDSEAFPTSRLQNIKNNNSIPLVTLGLEKAGSTGPAAITAGVDDAYLRQFAANAKAFGGEIWLRPFHEMNGNWYVWSGTGPGTPADVVTAWKHVRTLFTDAGATNVKFVWCPNGESVPNTAANSIDKYWPGDAYVDYVAIDSYNAGTSQSWSHWQSIGEAMGDSYPIITGLTQKPLFLAETGSVEQGGDKAAWIADFFTSIRTRYTRIVGVVWFDEIKTNQDWRVDSSAASLNAFATYAAMGNKVVSGDQVAPQVSITAPANGSTVAGIVQASANATDNVGVSKVLVYLDGVLNSTLVTSPYTTQLDTTKITNGSHTLSAKAYDAAGNVTNASITLTVSNAVAQVDTVLPEVNILKPLSGSTVGKKTVISVTATDNVKVSKIAIYIDGKLLTTQNSPTSATWSVNWNSGLRTVARGSHTITAKAYDAAGNISSASVTISK